MPVTLGELRRNVRTVPVEYMGLKLNVQYRPSAITPYMSRDEQDEPLLVAVLMKALIAWDVYIDDELTVMLPITPENLGQEGLGSGLLNAIVQAITLDSMVGKANGATSGDGSPPKGS